MKIADKEQLKVGDTVYTAQPLCLKWKNFRYPLFRKETIKRITPKRTKIVTNCGEYGRDETFYLFSEELERQNRMALIARLVHTYCLKFDNVNANNLSDKQLEKLLPLLEDISLILSEQ